MARIIMLKSFVNERLTAAAEEIFGVFERTIIQYEEEIDRQRKLVDLVLKPDINLSKTDQLLVYEEQQRSLSRGQEEPEPLKLKEEHEELWTNQGGEQLELEEADIIKLPFIPVHERRENEEEYQSIQTHMEEDEDGEGDPLPGTSTEQMKAEPRVEPDSYLDQARYLPSTSTEQIKTEPEGEDFSNYGQFLSSDCYRTETEDCGAWKEPGEPHSGSNRWRSNKMQKGQSFQISVESPPELRSPNQTAASHCCKVCSKSFSNKRSLMAHVKFHPRSCGLCGKHLEQTESLKLHFNVHRKCQVCGKEFPCFKGLERHERIHTGEKPFSCPVCGKGLGRNEQLQNHMRIHTGEKPFSCPVCGKRFNEKGTVKIHMRIHSGAKPYSCGLCGKRFRHSSRIGKHRCHTGE